MKSKLFKSIDFEKILQQFQRKNPKLELSIVEKDYWVTIVLDYLFSKFKYKDKILFKGGTCLSKSYNLIDRFSEDIDLYIDWKLLDVSDEDFFSPRSRSGQNKFNEKIELKTQVFLKEDFLPEMKKDFKEILKDYDVDYDIYIEESNPQVIQFKYPVNHKNDELLQTIKLEIGTLGDPLPFQERVVKSFLQEAFPQVFEGVEIKVKALDKQKNFYEKLMILHKEANRTNGIRPKRYSRHYYDVYKMLQTDLRLKSLENIPMFFDVIDFNMKFYYVSYAKHEEIKTGDIKLIPNEEGLKTFTEDFSRMKTMIFDKEIQFSTVMESIKEFEAQIQKAIKGYLYKNNS